MPLLILLAGFSERPAAATSLAAIGLTALAGAIGYALVGRVHVDDAALVGLPAAVGAIAGTTLQQRVPRRSFSLLFAAFLLVVAARLLVA